MSPMLIVVIPLRIKEIEKGCLGSYFHGFSISISSLSRESQDKGVVEKEENIMLLILTGDKN